MSVLVICRGDAYFGCQLSFLELGFSLRSSATRLYVIMFGLVTQPTDFLFLHACFVLVYALCALFWSLRCVRFWGR
jgi:hypothetical protein